MRQGVPLTPLRSIAVDKIHVYGTPFFIEANLPIESAKPTTPFRRLMIAQDTGSAIVGPARGDLYWGAGADAGRIAGRIRHPGRFVMLLPRELDMVAAGRHMPLPLQKPAIPEDGKKDESQEQTTRGEDRERRGKAKPEAAKREDQPKAPRKSRQQAGPDPIATGIMSADDGKQRRRKLSERNVMLWGRITRSIAPLRRETAPGRGRERGSIGGRHAPASRNPRTCMCCLRAAASTHASPSHGSQPLDRRQRAAARTRHRSDRRAHRPARADPERSARRPAAVPARAQSRRRQIRAGDHRQGSAPAMRGGRGVLKRQVPLWLKLPEFRPYVVGFETAHLSHGGEGALYVRVRRARAGR